MLVGAIALGALVVPHLPRGACFDDSGDLQAASCEFRPAHEPGYATYVAAGWVLAHVPGVEPAFPITLACCASGIIALALCARLQILLGAHPLTAGATVLIAALHPAVRDNLFVPEVYAPTAALLCGALLCLLRYQRTGHEGRLRCAALLLGAALGSRSPVVLLLPGFAIGAWTACRSLGFTRARAGRVLLATSLWAAVPVGYSGAFLLWRGRDKSPYWVGVPPEARAGASLGADLQRLGRYWAGSNYSLRWSDSWLSALGRMSALVEHGLAGRWKWITVAALPLCVSGFLRLARRAPPVAWSVGGLGLGAASLLILVHTAGTASDFLPLVLMAAVCAGMGVAAVEPRALRGRLLATRCVVLLAAALCVGQTYWNKPPIYDEVDARGFLNDLDLDSLARGALILTSYPVSSPIRYARHVSRRQDLEIICTESDDAQAILGVRLDDARRRERVVLLAGFVAVPDGWRGQPYRNIQRLSAQPGNGNS